MDENYVKMCLKAQDDLRRHWTPKGGDRVLTKWNSSVHKIELCNLSNSITGKSASELLHKCTDVWLPYQEDLQRIINENWPNDESQDWVTIFTDFNDWFVSYYIMENGAKKSYKFNDLTEIWLCFVMEVLFKKAWNSELKVWIIMDKSDYHEN
jgi:hypothetical protein